MAPYVLPEPESSIVLAPVLVKPNAPVMLPLRVMSPEPPTEEFPPIVRLPESVTGAALLFQMAPLKLAASWPPAPLIAKFLLELKPLRSRRPELEATRSAIVAPAVAFCDNVTCVALSMLTM